MGKNYLWFALKVSILSVFMGWLIAIPLFVLTIAMIANNYTGYFMFILEIAWIVLVIFTPDYLAFQKYYKIALVDQKISSGASVICAFFVKLVVFLLIYVSFFVVRFGSYEFLFVFICSSVSLMAFYFANKNCQQKKL